MHTKDRKRFLSPKERAGTLATSSLPPPGEGTEEALFVRALCERSESAFEALLDLYHSPMLRLAQVFVRSRDDAEEVVQETWMAVLSGIGRFQGRSSLKTWLFRILVYRARTHAKREARTTPFSSIPAAPAGSSDDRSVEDGLLDPRGTGSGPPHPWRVESPASGPEESLLATELRAQIEGAIRELPRRQQEVITLRDVEGWTAGEVCDLLKISEANQRVLLHRARVRVRRALTSYVGSASSSRAEGRRPHSVRASDRPPRPVPRRGRGAPASRAGGPACARRTPAGLQERGAAPVPTFRAST